MLEGGDALMSCCTSTHHHSCLEFRGSGESFRAPGTGACFYVDRPHMVVYVCAGVKVLLAGEQQAAVTVAVEGLMDAKPSPELDSFLTFDPKVRP